MRYCETNQHIRFEVRKLASTPSLLFNVGVGRGLCGGEMLSSL